MEGHPVEGVAAFGKPIAWNKVNETRRGKKLAKFSVGDQIYTNPCVYPLHEGLSVATYYYADGTYDLSVVQVEDGRSGWHLLDIPNEAPRLYRPLVTALAGDDGLRTHIEVQLHQNVAEGAGVQNQPGEGKGGAEHGENQAHPHMAEVLDFTGSQLRLEVREEERRLLPNGKMETRIMQRWMWILQRSTPQEALDTKLAVHGEQTYRHHRSLQQMDKHLRQITAELRGTKINGKAAAPAPAKRAVAPPKKQEEWEEEEDDVKSAELQAFFDMLRSHADA